MTFAVHLVKTDAEYRKMSSSVSAEKSGTDHPPNDRIRYSSATQITVNGVVINNEESEESVGDDTGITDSDTRSDTNNHNAWVCTMCKKVFTSDTAMLLECDMCEMRFCASCIKITKPTYKALSRSDVMWLCSETCQSEMKGVIGVKRELKGLQKITDILNVMSDMKSMLSEINVKGILEGINERMVPLVSKIESVNTKVDSVNKKMDCVQKAIPLLETGTIDDDQSVDSDSAREERDNQDQGDDKGESNKNPWKIREGKRHRKPNQLREIMKEAIVEQKEEEEEQKQREQNIVIYKLEESTDKSVKIRKEHDEKLMEELFNEVLEIDPPELAEVSRVGNRMPEKCRPLKVSFKCTADKTAVMTSLWKLRNARDPFKNISINEDLSKKEREEIRSLTETAKKWRAENASYTEMKFQIKRTGKEFRVLWTKRKQKNTVESSEIKD